jgi:hypothetical protein
MKKIKHKINFFTVIILALLFPACQQPESNYIKIEPAHIEHLDNSELSKITLTEKAAVRLVLKTGIVTEEPLGEGYGAQTQKVTPYASIIYDAIGQTWVYTNPEPLVYIRHEIKIDRIKGNKVYLLEGPPVGTRVATQGAAELYGTEYHVGH